MDALFEMLLFPDTTGDVDGLNITPHPLETFFEQTALDAELRKSTRGHDPAWDELIGLPAEKISNVDLSKRSSKKGQIKPAKTKLASGETMIEWFDFNGKCVSTTFEDAI